MYQLRPEIYLVPSVLSSTEANERRSVRNMARASLRDYGLK